MKVHCLVNYGSLSIDPRTLRNGFCVERDRGDVDVGGGGGSSEITLEKRQNTVRPKIRQIILGHNALGIANNNGESVWRKQISIFFLVFFFLFPLVTVRVAQSVFYIFWACNIYLSWCDTAIVVMIPGGVCARVSACTFSFNIVHQHIITAKTCTQMSKKKNEKEFRVCEVLLVRRLPHAKQINCCSMRAPKCSPRIEMNAKIDLDFWLGRWTRIVHFFLLVKLSPRIRIYIYKCKKNMKEMYICSDLTGREWKNTQTRRVYVKCMATHRHAHKLGRRAFIIVFLLRRIHRVYEHQTHSHRRQPYRAASCTCVRVCVCARRLRTTVSLLSGFNSATHTNTHTHASARDIFSPEPNESDSRFFLSFLNNILMQMRIVKRCDSNTYHFQCTQSILAGERGQPIKWIHNI